MKTTRFFLTQEEAVGSVPAIEWCERALMRKHPAAEKWERQRGLRKRTNITFRYFSHSPYV